jgi:mono/diheme cytochrome c family protein
MRIISIVACLIIAASFCVFGQTTVSDTKASIQRGKKVYDQYCLACHQADGGGVPRLNPPLQKTDYVVGDKKRLINIILKGLNDPIEIKGEEYVNPMASHAHLSDQQIADVLTYIRNNFGNKATAISPTEVKALRVKK